eukprot:gb/GEZN01012967.1/.p1 GENE.gb/GEZN01012967.1/~~gb/GEZN01012967.1/.p1  ORF type:complete len:331 (-),score=36.96 gb/GEZN01012967.1/:52-1011(-)
MEAAVDAADGERDDRSSLMGLALEQARLALDRDEVPVGCVFVQRTTGQVLAATHNQTNKKRNATRHCEFEAIDFILLHCKLDVSVLVGCDLYVTVEPCIMCASALRLVRIGRVFYGCANQRFGGNGSVFSLHQPESPGFVDTPGYPSHGGIRAQEAIDLLKEFYERGNRSAPPEKRHRPLKCANNNPDKSQLTMETSHDSFKSQLPMKPSADNKSTPIHTTSSVASINSTPIHTTSSASAETEPTPIHSTSTKACARTGGSKDGRLLEDKRKGQGVGRRKHSGEAAGLNEQERSAKKHRTVSAIHPKETRYDTGETTAP